MIEALLFKVEDGQLRDRAAVLINMYVAAKVTRCRIYHDDSGEKFKGSVHMHCINISIAETELSLEYHRA
ncbi:hypothetical protein SLS56_011741 [Neofusicoccum ribis]|uniref:Uncharacterized protein n=1 Tax=Neofusicoccum ribis TaxID=45134 RepID=A0ABR3SAW4_9PEZI